ncbi:alcohol dehydrogenase [Fusarium phyllophilum]|uniref:Alcohol dehydrogenase n=1 Tax=Fusarium phyllophilum TaxID=47803 RepID=A0A8H5NEV1_9HYPO|nr:alcohol dehydrogenase [Fusarium phyllophilum]
MALPKTTRRWVLLSLDGPSSLKLESVDLVPPGPNQVVVKIPLPLPYAPLSDAAGVVVAVGERVKNLGPGDKLFSVFKSAWPSGRQRREFEASNLAGPEVPGILSEYVVLDEEYWTPMPRNLTFVEASTLTVAGVTAWNALYGLSEHQLRPGQSILTEGAGGVSIFSLQFAKAGGAKVIATTSSTRKAEMLSGLGADHVINYKEVTDWADTVKSATPGNKGVDLVVDLVGGNTMTQAMKTVKSDGLVTIVGFTAGLAEQQPSTVDIFLNMATFRSIHCGSLEHYSQMNAAIEQHDIKPHVDRVFGFEDVPTAYTYDKVSSIGTPVLEPGSQKQQLYHYTPKDNAASNSVQWKIVAMESEEIIRRRSSDWKVGSLGAILRTLSPLTGVEGSTEEGISVVKSKSETDASAGRSNSGAADVWTEIAFTVSSETIHHKQDEHGISEVFNSSAQSWFAWVKAKSIFSKNNKEISDFMPSCTVSGYSVKTDDKSASQHTEVKDGALNISCQAPEIIGWVSEVLPELPWGHRPSVGGLNGAPVRDSTQTSVKGTCPIAHATKKDKMAA